MAKRGHLGKIQPSAFSLFPQAELIHLAVAGSRPLWKRMRCFSAFPLVLGTQAVSCGDTGKY